MPSGKLASLESPSPRWRRDRGNPQRLGRLQPPDGINESKAGPYRLLGVVLARLRVAEVHQHTIAHILGDKAFEARDHVSNSAMIDADDLAQRRAAALPPRLPGVAHACGQRGPALPGGRR